MHIVHLIARLNDGGPARVVATLAREMRHRGHHVTVLAGRCAEDEVDFSTHVAASGADVVTVGPLGRRLAAGDDLRALAEIVTRLRQLAPDVVHTHTAKAGTLGRLACRWLSLPCLHTYHGHVLEGYFSRLPSLIARAVERQVAGVAHHQAVTPSQHRELSLRFGIGRPRRWHCLPIPVESPERSSAPWHQRLQGSLPVIGFLGRFATVKDPELWLEALACLARHRPVQGLMCGDGALRAACEARAGQLRLPVAFTGFVPAGEALAACDVLLMSSRNEGLPLVAIEAAACGVPVVAPVVGGLRDLVRTGAVVGAVRTPEALAQACIEVLTIPPLRARAVAAGAALARSLAPAVLAPRYEALYRAIDLGGT